MVAPRNDASSSSIILQQPLEVIELDLRPLRIGKPAAEFFQIRRTRCTSISPGILTVRSSPNSRPRSGLPDGSSVLPPFC